MGGDTALGEWPGDDLGADSLAGKERTTLTNSDRVELARGRHTRGEKRKENGKENQQARDALGKRGERKQKKTTMPHPPHLQNKKVE